MILYLMKLFESTGLFVCFRILVLDKGEVKEFDSPKVLLSNKDSIFHGMAKDAGLV